jgi:hypothetical protein
MIYTILLVAIFSTTLILLKIVQQYAPKSSSHQATPQRATASSIKVPVKKRSPKDSFDSINEIDDLAEWMSLPVVPPSKKLVCK